MPGNGPHRLEFAGPTPLIFWVLAALLGANTLMGMATPLFPEPLGPSGHGTHYDPMGIAGWWAAEWLHLQYAFMVIFAVTLLVYRKRLRYTYRGVKQKKWK